MDFATPAGDAAAIELRAVRKLFGGRAAVDGIDLAVPRGAAYGLLGPNGAGKTTVIRMILRILDPTEGEIRVFGGPVTQRTLDRVGYLPEERGVYRRMRVGRLLAFFAEIKGVSRSVSRPRIESWLERMGLADRIDARVQELSKGMQQKLQFIAAVLHEPDIVILDEPFSGLDPLNQQVLREFIVDLRRSERTVLFSTHIIEHAERICDHVCIIAEGRMVLDGTMRDVKRSHAGEFVRIGLERWDGAIAATLRASSEVSGVREDGSEFEVALRPNADSQRLLEQLIRAGVRIRRFERSEASLEQIFVERVGVPAGAATEVAHV